MSTINNTYNAQPARSTVSGQMGFLILLSLILAVMRTVLMIVGAVSLGPAARYFFPEMFAITNNSTELLGVVAVDTFVVVLGFLVIRANAKLKSKDH